MTEQQRQDSNIDEVFKIKMKFINQVSKLYKSFLDTLGAIPCDPRCTDQALGFFDTGILWFEKGIAMAELKLEAVPTEPEPDAA